jgi:hypothetical protein
MRILKLFITSTLGSAIPLGAYFWWILTIVSAMFFGHGWDFALVKSLLFYTGMTSVLFGGLYALVHWSRTPTLISSAVAALIYAGALICWALFVTHGSTANLVSDAIGILGLSIAASLAGFLSTKLFGAGRITQ